MQLCSWYPIILRSGPVRSGPVRSGVRSNSGRGYAGNLTSVSTITYLSSLEEIILSRTPPTQTFISRTIAKTVQWAFFRQIGWQGLGNNVPFQNGMVFE